MGVPLVSIIMSVYNETNEELSASIESILNQTYKNIQFIIIGDNPNNASLQYFLGLITDPRVEVYYNEENMGLVASLNKALTYVKGEYIARMDADDISMPDRIEKQLEYLISNRLDIIGADLCIINEAAKVEKARMHFSSNEKIILKCIRWGNCLAHPAWMAKKKMYDELNGYRNVPGCEDYDFILRAIAMGVYHIGNMPYIGVKYRVRSVSVSQSNADSQYVLRSYIAKNKDNILSLSEEEILNYYSSKEFIEEKRKYNKFLYEKKEIKERKSIVSILKILSNKYFFLYLIEQYYLKLRERK